LDDWKAGKLKKFKKDVEVPKKPNETELKKIVKNNKWLEFFLVILGVGLLVFLLRMLA